MKILHIANCDRFIPPFIEEINRCFDFKEHDFLLTNGPAEKEIINYDNVTFFSENGFFSKLRYYFIIIIKMHQAERIILHGLFNQHLVEILFVFPWLLKRCYWVMWGGDLYAHQLDDRSRNVKEFFRRSVIKKIANLVTYIKGDVDNAREWYGAKGRYHECLMYQSNLFKDYKVKAKTHNVINIQIGNSADPSNNHIEILEKLLPFKSSNICIYAPLSYGCKANAEKVISTGRELFGEKFQPITQSMPFERYVEFLSSIDIAIFNHKRQQAMGNTITLLGMGKTVYLRSDTTQWMLFKEKDIVVKDIQDFSSLAFCFQERNVKMVKKYFSVSKYHEQLTKLFS